LESIWCYLSSNGNSAAVQAIAGMLQAGAAIITLGVMIWLGHKQSQIIKKQNNIVAYDKRHKLYVDLLQTLDQMISHEPSSTENWNQESAFFSRDFYSLYYKFKDLADEVPCLFENDFYKKVPTNKIMDECEKLHTMFIEHMNNRVTDRAPDYVKMDADKQSQKKKVRNLRDELMRKFQEYLKL